MTHWFTIALQGRINRNRNRTQGFRKYCDAVCQHSRARDVRRCLKYNNVQSFIAMRTLEMKSMIRYKLLYVKFRVQTARNVTWVNKSKLKHNSAHLNALKKTKHIVDVIYQHTQ